MQHPGASDNELEIKLAGFIRSYIHASYGEDSLLEQNALRWVCSGLEYLLGSLLNGCEGWRGWVDGILPATDMLPDAVKVSSGIDLTIHGQALWGEDARGPFWIEPFLGSVRISETHDAITGYKINFADAARGLATFPHDKHVRRAEWFSPAEWLFVFSKGTVGEEIVIKDPNQTETR
jgi:hypothetical protein